MLLSLASGSMSGRGAALQVEVYMTAEWSARAWQKRRCTLILPVVCAALLSSGPEGNQAGDSAARQSAGGLPAPHRGRVAGQAAAVCAPGGRGECAATQNGVLLGGVRAAVASQLNYA